MHTWLSAVPYGGYSSGPVRYRVGQLAPMSAPPAPAAGIWGALAITLGGLALTAGAGALLGWAIGGTRQTALLGAMFGVSAGPQIVSAVSCARRPV